MNNAEHSQKTSKQKKKCLWRSLCAELRQSALSLPVQCAFADWLVSGPAESPDWMNLFLSVCWACELRCSTSAARPPPHPVWPEPLNLWAPGQKPGTGEQLLPPLHLEQTDHNSRNRDNCKQVAPGWYNILFFYQSGNNLIQQPLIAISPLARSVST